MLIGIDVRLWSQTGVGRYIRNLVLNLETLDQRNKYILFAIEEDVEGIRKALGNDNFKIVPTDVRWHTLSEQTKFRRIINRENLDLVHFPYFSLPVFYQGSYVLTVHDLILNHFPTGKASTKNLLYYNLKRRAYLFVIKRAARNAKKIIAVSAATKHEIVDHLGVDGNKVSVIYEGVEGFVISKENASKPKDPYVLYVGNVYPHKNSERMILAFLKADKPRDAKLIFVGKEDFFYDNLKRKVGKLDTKGSIKFYGYVDDVRLASLYKNASALITPSLMEGFGLPVLEAMVNGCLVLCSSIPSLREIAGASAIYFDPMDIHDMSRKIEFALSGSNKEAYVNKGLVRSKNFSWKKMAKETLKVYDSSTSPES
ncbi:MAG: Glycosyl transferase, group 1 [uncultured bacterium]|nr:MAG: Glycosyl transferase, group 1 [uncultured bacterium]KKP96442.1 MAG: Glycosyl transferase, group 1 family [Candidatus Levybacteria bacterium GW2011_GWA2_36_13]KKR17818.1 MAG: Glycosyl transferase, group 1 family [Candidatus Levybacteria bacterium GW2011_GWA1_39_32]KKR51553.1 MAG: Glycosyl transferase, group 1 family [Candidatus Levybacteria bacterium GW2011_GWC1_40_19]KKS02268.1 MAG: Glycosyl transferase, group 1 family [Candidatus Levybacteria bacterium GW2011_GWB1_41_21]OGH20825.1 MAG